MPNNLTSLIPSLVGTLQATLKTRTGLLNCCDTSYDTKSVKKGDSIKVPNVTASPVTDGVVSANNPDLVDSTEEDVSLTLSYLKVASFNLSGEELAAMEANGPDYINKKVMINMSGVLDDIEDKLFAEAYVNAGYGATSANGLFSATDKLQGLGVAGTNLDQAGVIKMDRHFVYGAATQNKLYALNTPVVNTNEQGTDRTIRTGEFAPHFGFGMNFSAHGTKAFTKSTAASYTVDGATDKGTKVIAVADGSNDFKAGDVVSIGNFEYVVASFSSGDAELTLKAGLLEDVADDATITVKTSTGRDIALWRPSLIAAVRPPRADGDSAVDATILTDPDSGVSMRLAQYPGYLTSQYVLQVVYGVKVVKPEGIVAVYA